MRRSGVTVYSRCLRYRNKRFDLSDDNTHTLLVGEEKGIDVRIALDVIRMAHRREYVVALVLSRDQDLSEVADEIRVVAQEQNRWLKSASCYPTNQTVRNRRGVNKTDWIEIDRALYDKRIDPRDYRPR